MSVLATFLADASSSIASGAGTACGGFCNTNTINTVFRNLASTLTFLIGSVSVIMVIVGGLRYVTSRGNAKAVEEAKNTITYAVVGVVIAIVAFALVSFVAQSIGR